jgi:glycosyltransferase involved in cell wall biosynthesis
MPVFNAERHIRKALTALLNQTFRDVQIVISDNASQDGTEAVCRQYAREDRRVVYLRQSDNIGALANFEFVFQQSNAPYFMWAAHDDSWHPEFVQRCMAALEDDSSRAFAFGRWISISRRIPLLRIVAPSGLEFLEAADWRRRVLGYLQLSNRFHKANIVYSLWRREFLDGTRLKHMCELAGTESHVGQDLALCTAALFRGKGYIDKDVLFYKRYKNLPPGHWASRIELAAAGMFRRDRVRVALATEQMATDRYWKLVKAVMIREGLSALESDELLQEVATPQ